MALSCSDKIMTGYKSLVDCQIAVIGKAAPGEIKKCKRS